METNELLRDVNKRNPGALKLVDPPRKVVLSTPAIKSAELEPTEGVVRATTAELLKGCECKACKGEIE